MPSELTAALLAQARAAWPTVQLEGSVFVARLARLATGDEELKRLSTGDLYLACAVERGDSHALASFDAMLREVVAKVAREDTGELEQRLRVSLLVASDQQPPRISTYSGAGDLRSWLKVSAARLAIKLGTREREIAVGEGVIAALDRPGADPELQMLKDRYREPFARAFSDALGELERRDRLLMRYRFVDRLSLQQIARAFDVHDGTVSRWLQAARERIHERVLELLIERLGASADEVVSLSRVVLSDADVTLTRLLEHSPPP